MILRDKAIIITGVGPGMGRKLALAAAREGARVAVSARSQQFIESVRDEIVAAGGQAIASVTDVGDNAACEALAKTALDGFGRVDGLVNSAYYHPDWKTFEEADLDQWARAYDVACLGALRMIRAVLPTMKAQGGGAVVNVSTLATRRPMVGEGGYAIAKSALNQATRQLAVELGSYGVRVNSALMGWMMGVPLEAYFQANPGAQTEVAARIPLRRVPPDQDCAKSVLFLLSDYASEVTGAALDVNGGDWVAP
jgi:NAD(P)-dependent dehydrogenase (short-subunit alcohol dehydrogenase family)